MSELLAFLQIGFRHIVGPGAADHMLFLLALSAIKNQDKIGLLPTVAAVNVELVFDPPWNQSMMSEAARLEAGLL